MYVACYSGKCCKNTYFKAKKKKTEPDTKCLLYTTEQWVSYTAFY